MRLIAGLWVILSLSLVTCSTRVDTDEGPVLGNTREYKGQESSGKYFSFRGIPYALPPKGNLFLKDPKRWKDPRRMINSDRPINRNFTSPTDGVCLQYGTFFGKPAEVVGSTDCLFLSVYTTELPSESPDMDLKPVFFWIHGGGFAIGSGDMGTGPDFLLESGLVVVTINYRLGPVGFFANEELGATGNQGLKDQLEAMRWVRRNIAQFGGDPNRVTIAGESAGAISVHAHVLSPLGRDENLFHSAISFSGTMLMGNEFVSTVREQNKNFWKKVKEEEEKLDDSMYFYFDFEGCINPYTRGDDRSCLERFWSYAYGDMMLNQIEKYEKKSETMWFWPMVDDTAETPFLPHHPITILHNKQQKMVPWMTGLTKNDGAIYVTPSWKLMKPENNVLQENWDDIICPWLFLGDWETCKQRKMFSKVFTKFYLNGKEGVTRENKQEMMDLFTDSLFAHSNYESVKLHAQASAPVYNYLLTYRGSSSFSAFFAYGDEEAAAEDFGVVHGDDLMYTFNMNLNPNATNINTDEDRRFLKSWQKLISNFAKYANPTPVPLDGKIWKKAQSSAMACVYMDLGDEIQEKHRMFGERMEFWNRMIFQDLLEKHAVTEEEDELLMEIDTAIAEDDDVGNGKDKERRPHRGNWKRNMKRKMLRRNKRIARRLKQVKCH